MRLYVCIVFFILPLLVNAQRVAKQNREGEGNNKGTNFPETEKLNSNLTLSDSEYHGGALLFLELGMDFNVMKSTFCLSCHDGILVSGGHTNKNLGNPESVSKMSAIANFDHPVAFEYTRKLALKSRSLKDPESYSSSLRGTIAEVLLVDGRVECVTCHNIFFNTEKKERHNILNESVGTLLCLECHNR